MQAAVFFITCVSQFCVTTMSFIQELKAQAAELGLTLGDITTFVLQQQAYEREERQRESERKSEEREEKIKLTRRLSCLSSARFWPVC